ncbi:MAG TPA: ATP-binding protein, partial [Chitinophagaceae bacterium]|nr:ATP-binding protein [Chitinophagaceae bacterium]
LALKIISLLLLPSVIAAQQENQHLDSLYRSLSDAKSDTARMKAYCELGSYYRLEDRDSTVAYFEKALPIAVRLNLKFDEASILNNMGIIQMQLEKFPKSLEYYLKAINIARDPAIEKTIWNLPSGQTPRNARLLLLSESYDLIGLLNAYTGNWTDNTKNQMKNYREAEKYATAAGDEKQLAYIKFHMGISYMSERKLDSALMYMNEAISTFSKLQDRSGLGRATKYLGDTYQKMGNFNVAAHTVLQAIPHLKETNDQVHIALAYISLNRIYTDLNKNDSALHFAKESLKIFERRKDPFGKKEAYNLLTSSFNRLGQSDSAMVYLKLAKSLSDSLHDEERKNLLALQDLIVEEQAKLEKLEKEKIETREKLRIYLLLSGIVIVTGIGILLYRNNRHRKKTNETLRQRNEEIENALHQLKSTQTQLIQSEKMASLGVLTAGIAHEIQNPLNFVNNFSEVNKDLIEEVKNQKSKINIEDLDDLLDDIHRNNEKILQHGKRADAIVKGMLQHSRTSSGVKEPTDINALVDEYLRLAFHGIRAKDKSFNSDFSFIPDPNIGRVNVVPQDIGRVILNLVNNAFYAVHEKKKQIGDGYEPNVTVSTRLVDASENPSIHQSANPIIISVRDNGNGISQKIKDKIFQPFFTTKPTGEGTGLGLSLSYDIVKAHGGEIKVDSSEGIGTEFTVTLPV